MVSMDNKIDFVVTLENGETVAVTYNPDFLNHLEFRGNVTETGYRSDFPFGIGAKPSLDKVKEYAQGRAQELYDNNPAKYGITKSLF